MSDAPRPIRIGNVSGFYGDRFSAVREMLEGGDLDFIVGDYLAELTMLILGRDRLKNPDLGYAKTFLRQMEENLTLIAEKDVKVVVNAGGLNPHGLAVALRELVEKLGVDRRVAFVNGDDIVSRADELGLGNPIAANAYLGGFGIKAALDSGADIVVTGRVTDASLVVGSAAAAFGWGYDDLDQLAGAVVAGHVIECSAQATGGNYSFFTEIDNMSRLGFPIAEVAADGTSVITKHEGTGGAVLVGTVTAQLLYEIGGPRYYNPDATARIDTIALTQVGPDRVGISGVVGEAPPKNLKVSLNHLGGIRNEFEVVLTGLDIEAKAALFQEQFEEALPARPAELAWELVRLDRADADTEEKASAMLRCVARDPDPRKAGRQFSSTAVELALASYPGFTLTAPPGNGSPYGVFVPGYVDAALVPHRVNLPDGVTVNVEPSPLRTDPIVDHSVDAAAPTDWGTTVDLPLGTIAGSRSGDKGGSANIGVWVRSADEYAWLDETLSIDMLKALLPEISDLTVHRYPLPNMWAVNFVIEEVLGRGVAENVRFDPQAKGLGEWLRSRVVAIPKRFVGAQSTTTEGN